jgi:hypothetical protein
VGSVSSPGFTINPVSDFFPGVIKSYKLTYEPASIQHAVFDRSRATNQWTADPRFLKQIIEHFSLSAEQLDIYYDSGKAVFTSFTTKIMDGKGIAKSLIIERQELTTCRGSQIPRSYLCGC